MIGQKVIILNYWTGEIGVITKISDNGKIYHINCTNKGIGGFHRCDFMIATPLTEALI